MTERTEARQQGYTERQENRQQYAGGYYGGYYGGGPYYYDHHWDDDWDGGEVAAVALGAAAVGAMAGYAAGTQDTTSTVVYNAPTGITALPCTPTVTAVSGVTYYRCNSTWYTQAYTGDTVTYVVVAPPPGY